MSRLIRLIAFVVLAAAVLGMVGVAASQGHNDDNPCELRTFEGADFTVCRYDPRSDRLAIRLGDGGFEALKQALGADSARVRFAMNGGMYEPDRTPVGLLVIGGRTVREANRAEGLGNFYLKPNGVFWTDAEGAAHIGETGRFTGPAAFATQSGPLLLQDGALHPAVQTDGASRHIRNGVCTPRSGGEAFFVISQGEVSFGKLARLMRDALPCRDALYFDGTVSSLWSPPLGRLDKRAGLGPLIVVSR